MRPLSLLGTVSAAAATVLNFATGSYSALGTSYALESVPGLSLNGPSIASYAATSSGGLTSFDANVPRITDLGLLIEPSATNIQYNNTLPVTPPYSSTPGQTDPAGGANAYFVYGYGYTCYGGACTEGVTQTISLYVKAGGSNQYLNYSFFYGAASGGTSITFDIINGVVCNSVGVSSSSITPLGSSGWFILAFTWVPSGSNSYINYNWHMLDGPTGSSISSAYNIYHFGGQQELGSAATSYITSNSSGNATRSADVATYTYSPVVGTAHVITAAGSTLISPTSPIDFGADSGGSWVGGYVKSLTVGS